MKIKGIGLNRCKIFTGEHRIIYIITFLFILSINVMKISTIYKAYRCDKSYKPIHFITFVGYIIKFILILIILSTQNLTATKSLLLIPFSSLYLFSSYRAYKLNKSKSFIHDFMLFVSVLNVIKYPFEIIAIYEIMK